MAAIHHAIEKNLYLVRQDVSKAAKPVNVTPPVHHIAVIDCSGSMYSELPKLRAQLKKRLPMLLKAEDTMSIIWFSGRGQCGVLLEAEPVATLTDLQAVNTAIDRWLNTVGLTGFKEPIEEAEKLVARVSKTGSKDAVFAMFFMSDGCDNQWDRNSILKAVEKTGKCLASATFVEYGFYADRNLLSAMAEKAGGNLIFAENFNKYEPEFERALTKPMSGGKRIEVKIDGDPILGLCWALDSATGDLLTFDASTGKALVPEGLNQIAYLTSNKGKAVGDDVGALAVAKAPQLAQVYAALSILAVRMKPEIVYPILKALGDVKFIKDFSICFGKQKYSDFMLNAQAAAFEPKLRFVDGRDPSLVPPDDAFTVLDLLKTLQSDDGNKLLLDHKAFVYTRISRERVDGSENLSAAEQAQVDEIQAKMAKTRSAPKLKELQAEINAILATKTTALKFVADEAPDGYAISNLTFNEETPNVSVLIRKTGSVDLTSRNPDAKLPNPMPTFIFRNYAIVKDGIVNVEKLPVKLSKASFETLKKHGVEMVDDDGVTVINVKPLPIINRKMVKTASAKALFELEWELTKFRAAQKVYNAIKKEKWPKTSEGYAKVYGEELAAWLKDQGLTDYGGFSPKMVQAESTDFYMAKQLDVKLKGYSTLPSLKDAREKMAKGKPNGPTRLMIEAITEVDKFFAKNPPNLHEKWLDGKLDVAVATTRGLIYNKAQLVFSTIVGQVWFQEFVSLDENSMTLKLDGEDLAATVEMKEVEVKI